MLTVYDRLPSTFGQDRYLLTNMPDDEAAYDGLEVDWGLETPRWYSMAGIAAYRSNGSGGNRGFHVNENDQGVIGELYEDPNATTFSSPAIQPASSRSCVMPSRRPKPRHVSACSASRVPSGFPCSGSSR